MPIWRARADEITRFKGAFAGDQYLVVPGPVLRREEAAEPLARQLPPELTAALAIFKLVEDQDRWREPLNSRVEIGGLATSLAL